MTSNIGVPIIAYMNTEPDLQYIVSSLTKVGLTQAKIASGVPCSQPTISDILSGKAGITRPSAKLVRGLTLLAKRHKIPLQAPKEAVEAQS